MKLRNAVTVSDDPVQICHSMICTMWARNPNLRVLVAPEIVVSWSQYKEIVAVVTKRIQRQLTSSEVNDEIKEEHCVWDGVEHDPSSTKIVIEEWDGYW